MLCKIIIKTSQPTITHNIFIRKEAAKLLGFVPNFLKGIGLTLIITSHETREKIIHISGFMGYTHSNTDFKKLLEWEIEIPWLLSLASIEKLAIFSLKKRKKQNSIVFQPYRIFNLLHIAQLGGNIQPFKLETEK